MEDQQENHWQKNNDIFINNLIWFDDWSQCFKLCDCKLVELINLTVIFFESPQQMQFPPVWLRAASGSSCLRKRLNVTGHFYTWNFVRRFVDLVGTNELWADRQEVRRFWQTDQHVVGLKIENMRLKIPVKPLFTDFLRPGFWCDRRQ